MVFVDADNKILATGFDPAEAARGLRTGPRRPARQALACRCAVAPVRRVPGRLIAPEPGWTTTADVVVIGSGIAGLTAALRLRGQVDKDPGRHQGRARRRLDPVGPGRHRRRARPGRHPAASTRSTPSSPGAGACDLEAVRVLVTEGPEAVRELIALGTNFDHDPDGELSLTREGGHHRDRIAHAGGDATGAEIQRALIAAIEQAPEIEVDPARPRRRPAARRGRRGRRA